MSHHFLSSLTSAVAFFAVLLVPQQGRSTTYYIPSATLSDGGTLSGQFDESIVASNVVFSNLNILVTDTATLGTNPVLLTGTDLVNSSGCVIDSNFLSPNPPASHIVFFLNGCFNLGNATAIANVNFVGNGGTVSINPPGAQFTTTPPAAPEPATITTLLLGMLAIAIPLLFSRRPASRNRRCPWAER